MLEKLYCSEDGCSKEALNVVRELCNAHYQSRLKSKTLRPVGVCTSSGCDRDETFRGLCSFHRKDVYPEYFGVKCKLPSCRSLSVDYGRCQAHQRKNPSGGVFKTLNIDGSPKKCTSEEGCDSYILARGLCSKHYRRVRLYGGESLPVKNSFCPVESCGRSKASGAVVCKRCRLFQYRYSLSLEKVFSLHESANRACNNPGCNSSQDLTLDHDHACCPTTSTSGNRKASCGLCVRGWLCRKCNTSLGMLEENPRKIRGLLHYLEGFK